MNENAREREREQIINHKKWKGRKNVKERGRERRRTGKSVSENEKAKGR